MYKPVIVAVGYNRPLLMERLLKSIKNANYDGFDDVTLIVSIDESDKSDAVEKVAKELDWKYGEKIIRRYPERQGLRKHIISCGDLSEQYGSVIILEDDLIVSPWFYLYTCKAHESYSNNSQVCGISLYSHGRNQFTYERFVPMYNGNDTFLGQMVVTWGQSWTFEQWKRFKEWYLLHEEKLPDINRKMPDEISLWKRSWGKYFSSYIVEQDLYYVYPYHSLTTCFSSQGEHNKSAVHLTVSQVPLYDGIFDMKFGAFDDLVRYDAFYERILPPSVVVCGIPGSDICMDLSGMKSWFQNKKYVITNRKLKTDCVYSFGLDLKPVEMNILNDNQGNNFYLYNSSEVEETLKRKNQIHHYDYLIPYDRLCYEHLHITWKALLRYFLLELKKRFIRRGRK